MIRNIEIVTTSKRKKPKKLFYYLFIFISVLFFFYLIFSYKDWLSLQIRKIFLPENIKFAELKFINLQKALESEILNSNSLNNDFYKNIEKREEYLKKVEENIHLFKFFEENSPNLEDLYYFLGVSYFIKIILSCEFTKENLLLQITRGILPSCINTNKNLNLEEGQLILRKYMSIHQNYENNPNALLAIIALEFFNTNILSKFLLKNIDKIHIELLSSIFKPYYEWFFLTLNSNFGKIEAIHRFLNLNLFWKFSENEKLLIKGITYYYSKDYYNFLKIFYEYKNKNFQPYKDLTLPEKFVYKEFLRIGMETYFLQNNFFLARTFINELEEILKTENDQYLRKRIEIIQKKMK